ncbi:MAG: glycosyl transferase family 36 [Candidatus Aureabacteria bacterium]|nr:glycosyl transferase family 36 [Candidatus Auribacterota bacterium]
MKIKNKYGCFSPDGWEYIIERPDTPRPWVNVICNETYGFTVSQTGGGYSWAYNSNLNRLTRWEQDLIKDNSGKYLYIRDEDTGDFWSAAWKPTCTTYDYYQCVHGVGYSVFKMEKSLLYSEMSMFVPLKDDCEIWIVKLHNKSDKKRTVNLFSYLEWLNGSWPDSHREFHKVFQETRFNNASKILTIRKRLGGVSDTEPPWNTTWPYVGYHTSSVVSGYEGDKEEFLGMYGDLMSPKAVKEGRLSKTIGKWNDSIGSIRSKVELKPDETKEVVFILGMEKSEHEISKTVRKYITPAKAYKALNAVRDSWKKLMSGVEIKTPDENMNVLTNIWMKYQTISARIQGRAAYYQSSGAYGYRDQLQDSQIFLPLNPDKTKERILDHARHQFSDGTVYHWWNTLSDKGPKSEFSDDLLWLPFIIVNYLKETVDFPILKEMEPFVDKGRASLYEHCKRAIAKSLSRRSKRGLPLIGEGDWNDGLSSCGDKWKGESIWMGHFLYGILNEFVHLAKVMKDKKTADMCIREARKLKKAVNLYGWDGRWFWRATTDSRHVLGSSAEKSGKIFLNAQTWAIINGVVDDPKRIKSMLSSMEKNLYKEYGPILFHPAYDVPNPKIGYLTRYAPGMRENGGLYTHAGVWAIQAECVARRPDVAYRLYSSFNPIKRSTQAPDLYKCEPYVTAGNVDGPDSPNFGRGGWTWYTGSAAWYYRIACEWILGVRPTYDGLIIDPCIPSTWRHFEMSRKFRGATYHIRVRNPKGSYKGVRSIIVDGKEISGNMIKPFKDKKKHEVLVVLI